MTADPVTVLTMERAMLPYSSAPRRLRSAFKRSPRFNMDASDLERKLTLKTRAIVVQHTYGIPAEMDAILQVAQRTGLPIIEDCCHTLASTLHNKTVGSFGEAAFYSFEWGKPIVVGIGGSAVVNDSELREKVQKSYINYHFPSSINQIRLHLQYLAHHVLYRPSFYWPVRWIYHTLGALGVAESNYNPIQGGNVAEDFSMKMAQSLQERLVRKLEDLESITEHNLWVTEQYRNRIQSNAVLHPVIPIDSEVVFARYPLVSKDKAVLLTAARKANVELAEWYLTPIHPLSNDELSLVNYEVGSCPHAEERCRQVLTLPTHRAVVQHDIDRAVKFLNSVLP